MLVRVVQGDTIHGWFEVENLEVGDDVVRSSE